MDKLKVAINGFGRIGRAFFKQALDDEKVEIVAINDLGELENLVYLLRFDSAYGRYNKEVKMESDGDTRYLSVDGEKVRFINESDPNDLPWKELDVDVVVESTGVFTEKEKAAGHIKAGAKRVVISANAKGGVDHVILGANDFSETLDKITSDGSCTTNAIVPLASLLEMSVGIERGFMTTVHGYTASQNIVDGPNGKFERGRAGAQNIVLTTTSAAEAAPKALPFLEENTFDAMAIRVPVITGSVVDFIFVASRDTTAEEINEIFTNASKEEKWQKTLSVTSEKLVSSDIIGEPYGAIVAMPETKVLGGNLVKVMAWYDNEWGYTQTLLEHVKSLAPYVN
ncbi:MAG: glyceraldehyde 3-phosphate dehydrogenase NAD-binding domain-containing protein [Candidatus Campbellbacteria bacterium]|nr:glyceraldehyde 3-phosphate dehydrogenase NAD-binding domain-containing protein [Candidatus Campbellbacteria bacterium]